MRTCPVEANSGQGPERCGAPADNLIPLINREDNLYVCEPHFKYWERERTLKIYKGDGA